MMRHLGLIAIFMVLLAGALAEPAAAQSGIYISQTGGCTGDTRLTAPIAGRTFCFDQVQNNLYKWTGAWAKLTTTSVPVKASEGGTGLDTSALTGVPSLAAGVWSIGAVKPPATGSGSGIFAPASCASIGTPLANVSECFNTTTGVWYNYDGVGWQSDAALSTGVTNIGDSRWGAVADGVVVVDAAMTSGSSTITSVSGQFSSAYVGKSIRVRGAGIAGADVLTTISSVTNSTTAVLATAASTTVTGATAVFGTDNSSSIQAALNSGKPVWVPGSAAAGQATGRGYLFLTTLTLPQNTSLLGVGLQAYAQPTGSGVASQLYFVGTGSAMTANSGGVGQQNWGLLVNGISLSGYGAGTGSGITLNNVTLWKIVNSQIAGFTNGGGAVEFIGSNGVGNGTIADSFLTQNSACIYSHTSGGSSNAAQIDVRGTTCTGSRPGLRAGAVDIQNAAQDLNFVDNTFGGCNGCNEPASVVVFGAKVEGLVFVGNFVNPFSNATNGLVFSGAGVKWRGITVSGNTFFSSAPASTGRAVSFSGVGSTGNGVTVRGNMIEAFATATNPAIDPGGLVFTNSELSANDFGTTVGTQYGAFGGGSGFSYPPGLLLLAGLPLANGQPITWGTGAGIPQIQGNTSTGQIILNGPGGAGNNFTFFSGLQVGAPAGGNVAGGFNIPTVDGYQVNGVALKAITETLSNKTLASPVFSGTVSGTYTLGGTPTFTIPAGVIALGAAGGTTVNGPNAFGAGNFSVYSGTNRSSDWNDTQPSYVILSDTNDTAIATLLRLNVEQITAGAKNIKRAIKASGFMPPDNGGDSSVATFVQSGGGNALTAYRAAQLRPAATYTDYTTTSGGGYAFEAGSSAAYYGVGLFAGWPGAAAATNYAGSLLINVNSAYSGANGKGILINPYGTYDSRIAIGVANPVYNGLDTGFHFAVLMNGNVCVGGSPAEAGVAHCAQANGLQFPNNVGIISRNAADNADINMWTVNGSNILTTGAITPAATGTRYLCISTTGTVTSSAAACSGT